MGTPLRNVFFEGFGDVYTDEDQRDWATSLANLDDWRTRWMTRPRLQELAAAWPEVIQNMRDIAIVGDSSNVDLDVRATFLRRAFKLLRFHQTLDLKQLNEFFTSELARISAVRRDHGAARQGEELEIWIRRCPNYEQWIQPDHTFFAELRAVLESQHFLRTFASPPDQPYLCNDLREVSTQLFFASWDNPNGFVMCESEEGGTMSECEEGLHNVLNLLLRDQSDQSWSRIIRLLAWYRCRVETRYRFGPSNSNDNDKLALTADAIVRYANLCRTQEATYRCLHMPELARTCAEEAGAWCPNQFSALTNSTVPHICDWRQLKPGNLLRYRDFDDDQPPVNPPQAGINDPLVAEV
ncbi:hypothetical protein OC845_004728 [Tilletia horrida]|nr:hypothetical protein OC845_004728 [Tilletia horrida]